MRRIFLAQGTTRCSRGIRGLSDRRFVHGRWTHRKPAPLLRAWEAMFDVCEHGESNIGLVYYQQRGIRVYPAWRRYAVFEKWALANGYKPGLFLSRKNKCRSYSPANCFWDSFKRRVPVRCVETGERFVTIKDAAHAVKGNAYKLSRAIRRGVAFKGRHWVKIAPTPDLRRLRTIKK